MFITEHLLASDVLISLSSYRNMNPSTHEGIASEKVSPSSSLNATELQSVCVLKCGSHIKMHECEQNDEVLRQNIKITVRAFDTKSPCWRHAATLQSHWSALWRHWSMLPPRWFMLQHHWSTLRRHGPRSDAIGPCCPSIVSCHQKWEKFSCFQNFLNQNQHFLEDKSCFSNTTNEFSVWVKTHWDTTDNNWELVYF